MSRWTILLAADETARVDELELFALRTTEFQLSGLVLGLLTTVVAAAGSALLVVLAFFSWQSVQVLRGWLAEHRLRSLAAEVTWLDQRTAAFADSIDAAWAHQDQERFIAGLDPLKMNVAAARRGALHAAPASVSADDLSWPEGSPVAQRLAGVDARINLLTRQASIVAASAAEVKDSMSAYAHEKDATPSVMPTVGYISSVFTAVRYHPILHEDLPHTGIDIAATYGTRVLAPATGRVVEIAEEAGYGLMVVLDHGHGLQTLYAHLSKAATTVGDTLTRGDLIGFVGSSGLSTGPHLHYEVRINGQPVNPRAFTVPDAFDLVRKRIWDHTKHPGRCRHPSGGC